MPVASPPSRSRKKAPTEAARRRLISILIPVFNEEANVDAAHEALSGVADELSAYDVEFLFTDNHSTDETFDRLADLAARDPRVKVLRFKRNYGFQRSLLTAYKHASGDAAIQIDCDLQDPPELLPRFVALWENGHDVVVGLRRRRQESRLLTLGRRSFYKILNNISDERITPNAGDFRLVDRSVLDRLGALDDQNPYVRGIISTLAANETGIPYDRIERRHGKSKFPVRKLFGFAFNGIFGHSIVPLRIATYVGLLASCVTALLSLFYLVAAFFLHSAWPSGFATTTVLILFGISLNAIFLGIIGEYISRIYQQVRSRPLVIVEKRLNMPEKDQQP
jgi:glycosyltransferase involved in cell wall biosynthesis